MAIQLKQDPDNPNNGENTSPGFAEERADDNKFRGGIGDRTVDIDKINDLPTYTGPTMMSDESTGVNSGRQKRKIISLTITGIILILVAFGIYKGTQYLVGSSGKDITNKLTMTEDELAKDMKIEFTDNEAKVKSVQQYSNGTVTVRSGGDLNIIYINGKQMGINTSSRKYRFYNVGINDPEVNADRDMTFEADGAMSILSDMTGGKSDAYYYYNEKNNDCLVVIVSKESNRVVDMTYYYDYKKVTENLGSISE